MWTAVRLGFGNLRCEIRLHIWDALFRRWRSLLLLVKLFFLPRNNAWISEPPLDVNAAHDECQFAQGKHLVVEVISYSGTPNVFAQSWLLSFGIPTDDFTYWISKMEFVIYAFFGSAAFVIQVLVASTRLLHTMRLVLLFYFYLLVASDQCPEQWSTTLLAMLQFRKDLCSVVMVPTFEWRYRSSWSPRESVNLVKTVHWGSLCYYISDQWFIGKDRLPFVDIYNTSILPIIS